MKEIKIEVPEGYEIDKENSTFEKIIFKEKKGLPMSWKDLGKVKGWYVTSMGFVYELGEEEANRSNKGTWPTKELAEAALALSQLLQLMDRWNGDWKADWNNDEEKFCLYVTYGNVNICESVCEQYALAFPNKDVRNKFYNTFKDLIETAKPLL